MCPHSLSLERFAVGELSDVDLNLSPGEILCLSGPAVRERAGCCVPWRTSILTQGKRGWANGRSR
ncbi:hypothetical protein A8U91_01405 [Halomonas elongata]|uniref:Uncharacterized protein n=1 Tax=Halomonas elongata TaxID=2746 RepID=A0A1B8P492_HALEL|nr:hypothetical protein A8U91_01405 [Halomonas elongata]